SDRLRRRQHAPPGSSGRGPALVSIAAAAVFHLAAVAIHIGCAARTADDGRDRSVGGGRVLLFGRGSGGTAGGLPRRSIVRYEPVHYAGFDRAVPGDPAAVNVIRGVSLLLPSPSVLVGCIPGDGVPDALRSVGGVSGAGRGVVPGWAPHDSAGGGSS